MRHNDILTHIRAAESDEYQPIRATAPRRERLRRRLSEMDRAALAHRGAPAALRPAVAGVDPACARVLVFRRGGDLVRVALPAGDEAAHDGAWTEPGQDMTHTEYGAALDVLDTLAYAFPACRLEGGR